jgi:DNA-binding response OmpR family regulator
MTRRLLLVEDDRALATGLADAFALEGFEVTVARDGERALALGLDQPFAGVVLDLMLPGRSGLDVLRGLRGAQRTTPVLILTAKGGEADKVLGLELGADDYVTKPFSLRELIARVRALVRRGGAREEAASPVSQRFQVGGAAVDLGAFTLARGGTVHELSRKEAALLDLLWRRRGQAVRRADILRLAWEGGEHVSSRTIDTHVLHLRQKLESDPAAPRHLLTVHGVGYRLDP